MPVTSATAPERLTLDIFTKHREWAKQVFAIRLMFVLFPPRLTRQLPRAWWKLISDPAEIPPPILPPGPPPPILLPPVPPGPPIPGIPTIDEEPPPDEEPPIDEAPPPDKPPPIPPGPPIPAPDERKPEPEPEPLPKEEPPPEIEPPSPIPPGPPVPAPPWPPWPPIPPSPPVPPGPPIPPIPPGVPGLGFPSVTVSPGKPTPGLPPTPDEPPAPAPPDRPPTPPAEPWPPDPEKPPLPPYWVPYYPEEDEEEDLPPETPPGETEDLPILEGTPFPDWLDPDLPDDYEGNGPEDLGPGIKPWESPAVPHSQKPKPIMFYWEFWGDTLCANHNWSIYTPKRGEILCPAIPYSNNGPPTLPEATLDIIDGALRVTQDSWIHTFNNYLAATWTASVPDPGIVNATFLTLKVAAAMLDASHVADSAYIALWDGTVYSRLHFANGNPSALTPPHYYIGDNAGLVQHLTLTHFGFPPLASIQYIYLYTEMNYPATIAFDIDYLTFQ